MHDECTFDLAQSPDSAALGGFQLGPTRGGWRLIEFVADDD